MDIKEKLIRNTIVNYIGKFWGLILGFLLFPFIIKHIGLIAAGVWLLFFSIIEYFGILDLGISPSLVKYVSECEAKEERKKISGMLNTALFIYMFIGGIAALGVFVIGGYFVTIFKIPYSLWNETKLIIYIVTFTLFFSFPLGAFGGILGGLQRYDKIVQAEVISSSVRAFLIFIFLSIGYGVVVLIIIHSLSLFLHWLINIYHVRKIAPYIQIKLGFSNIDKSIAKQLFQFGGALVIIKLAAMLIFHMDNIVISIFLGVGMIAFYEAARKIYSVTNRIPLILLSAIMPASSELDAKREKEKLRNLFIRSTKYTIALFLPIAIPIMLLTKPILNSWMGSEFGQYSLVLQILMLHVFVNINHSAAGQIMVGMNRIKFLLQYHIILALSNVALSIILVQKIGIVGVALGTTLPFIAMEWFYMKVSFKFLETNFKTYLRDVLLKVYPQAIVVGAILYFAYHFIPPKNLFEIVIYGGLSIILYFPLFYLFGLGTQERMDLKGVLKPLESLVERG